ncbi:MAG TPA: hypothetical protein ENJ50_04535, partial [Planctomycetaceae bacterium]|nr:hypothetical protein [Planctomycetaceae bacterium]
VPQAELRFVFADTAAPLVRLDDADFVTIENVDASNAQFGILASNGSTDLALRSIVASGNRDDGIRFESASRAVAIENIDVSNNGGFGLYADAGVDVVSGSEAHGNGASGFWIRGPLTRFDENRAEGNAVDGIWLEKVGAAAIEANVAIGNGRNGVVVSNPPGTTAVVGNADLTLERGNRAPDNKGAGIVGQESVRVEGNTVARNDVGIRTSFGTTASRNIVWGNRVGISVRRGGALTANRVYANRETGIEANDRVPIDENVVYSNRRGMELGFWYSGPITHNLVYDHEGEGILVRASGDLTHLGGRAADLVDIRNNTFASNQRSAVRIEAYTKNAELANNVFWADSGAALSVATDSQVGFASDHNLFYVIGDGIVARWAGRDYPTFLDWRRASFQDASSLSADPLFIDADGDDGWLGYHSPENDGQDDDFHLQSQAGSHHGGALAPVLDRTTGLPRFLSGVWTSDSQTSPGIDRGAASDSPAAEPSPNGGFVNVGAYGGTPQASHSPDAYLTVILPGVGETWPAEQTADIIWRSHDTSGTVDIQLIREGTGLLEATIADDVPNDG